MKQIGVIIPVFNGEKTIEKSIKSLLYQTYKDWVAIIINDGSTDNTNNILKKHNDDNRFHVLNFKENKGRPYARQKGLEIVRELKLKYMCMLDADDWYYPNKLKFQFEMMENNIDLSMLSSAFGLTDKYGNLCSVTKPFEEYKTFIYENYLDFVKLPHASSIIRVSSIDINIGYDLELKLTQDQDFLRRLLINKKYAFDSEIQYIYNRENSFSVNKYRCSMYYDYLSFQKLKFGFFVNIKYKIKNKIKYAIIVMLYKLNIINLYFKRIGVNPSKKELETFNSHRKIINNNVWY